MVTVTCKESGINFEAANKRTKIAPAISALKASGVKLQADYQGSWYEIDLAMSFVRKAGIYISVDEFVIAVKGVIADRAAMNILKNYAAAQKYARLHGEPNDLWL